jgi:3-dehydroquinate dehydratase
MMLTREPFRLASTVAKLKAKKLVGLGANEVKHVI